MLCADCQEPIVCDVLYYNGLFWHKTCFKCSGCRTPINATRFLMKEPAQIWCETCHWDNQIYNENFAVGQEVILSTHYPDPLILEDCIKGGTSLEFIKSLCLQTPQLAAEKDKYGRTLLYMASKQGDTELVEFLLQQPDIDINATQITNSTPLHAACYCAHFETAKLLVKANARIDIINNHDRTPEMECSAEFWEAAQLGAAYVDQSNEYKDFSDNIIEVAGEPELFEFVQGSKGMLVVLDFYAKWNHWCKQMSLHYKNLSISYEDVIFLRHNAVDGKPFCGVNSYPMYYFYMDGAIVEKLGKADFSELRSLINKHKALKLPAAQLGAAYVDQSNEYKPEKLKPEPQKGKFEHENCALAKGNLHCIDASKSEKWLTTNLNIAIEFGINDCYYFLIKHLGKSSGALLNSPVYPPETKHPGDAEYKCDLCDITLSQKSHLSSHLKGKRHLRKKAQKDFLDAGEKCASCNVVYKSKDHKKLHLNSKKHKLILKPQLLIDNIDKDLEMEAKEDEMNKDNWVAHFCKFLSVKLNFKMKKPSPIQEVSQISEKVLTDALANRGVGKSVVNTTGHDVIKKVQPRYQHKLKSLMEPDKSPALAIAMYTGNAFYKNLNNALRDEEMKNQKELDDWTKISVHIIKGLGVLPVEASKVFRGTSFTGDRQLYEPGSTIAWHAFSSTSRDYTVAQRFAGYQVSTEGHFFIIHTQKAKDISFISNYPQEKELLLTAGTFFRVVAVKSKEKSQYGVYTIEMEEWEVKTRCVSLWVGRSLQMYTRDKRIKEAKQRGVECYFIASVGEANEWITKRNYYLTRSRSEFRVLISQSAVDFLQFICQHDYDHTALVNESVKDKKSLLGCKYIISKGDRQTVRFGCFVKHKK